jgi:predicted protein tyrosine phosphatase
MQASGSLHDEEIPCPIEQIERDNLILVMEKVHRPRFDGNFRKKWSLVQISRIPHQDLCKLHSNH